MKINWGAGIVIAFVLFMGFILYFVIEVQSNSKYDNELVVKEYYKKDMTYGDDLLQMQRTENLIQKPEILSQATGIEIVFPASIDTDEVKGNVLMYRPSSGKLDFSLPLRLTDSHLSIPESMLKKGQWNITLQWTYKGESYLQKKKLYFKK